MPFVSVCAQIPQKHPRFIASEVVTQPAEELDEGKSRLLDAHGEIFNPRERRSRGQPVVIYSPQRCAELVDCVVFFVFRKQRSGYFLPTGVWRNEFPAVHDSSGRQDSKTDQVLLKGEWEAIQALTRQSLH